MHQKDPDNTQSTLRQTWRSFFQKFLHDLRIPCIQWAELRPPSLFGKSLPKNSIVASKQFVVDWVRMMNKWWRHMRPQFKLVFGLLPGSICKLTTPRIARGAPFPALGLSEEGKKVSTRGWACWTTESLRHRGRPLRLGLLPGTARAPYVPANWSTCNPQPYNTVLHHLLSNGAPSPLQCPMQLSGCCPTLPTILTSGYTNHADSVPVAALSCTHFVNCHTLP